VPTTLVALEAGGGALMGSVSLIVDDLEPWKGKYSPWLASLFVHPSFRGRGVGAELVRRLVDAAGEAGVRTLYVFAARSEAFYERLGWSTVERVEHHGYPSAIMAVPCRRESAREGLHSG
jgi:N-acetylglutamate synthase-like GNAT family acetyltransferase